MSTEAEAQDKQGSAYPKRWHCSSWRCRSPDVAAEQDDGTEAQTYKEHRPRRSTSVGSRDSERYAKRNQHQTSQKANDTERDKRAGPHPLKD